MSRKEKGTHLHIIVEGQTEETFVREIIRPYLYQSGIATHWHVIINSSHRNRVYRGGVSSGTYERLKADIIRSMHNSIYVSTMFDFYGLPCNFPGTSEAQQVSDPREKVRIIEDAMAADIGSDLFIPYIALHEFESLLFSNVNKIDEVMRVHGKSKMEELLAIQKEYPNPEYINTRPESSPSHRLKFLYPGYQKVSDGILIAHRISLSRMRKVCPHFDTWIHTLESLKRYRF